MANEQDVMKIVAEVVDKSTGTLKKIQDSYKQLGDAAAKSHEKGSKEAREHSKHLRELHERFGKIKENVSDAVVPALATMGITAFGVGEAIGTLAEKIKGASEKYQALNDTIKRGHVSSTFVQGMGDAFQRLGMDASKANEFIGETGETLDKLRRGNADEMQRLTDTFGNTLPWLEKVVAGARNYQDAAERIMKALTNQSIPIDQRRKLAEAFHLDPRIASKNGEEVGKAIADSMADAAKHSLNVDTLRDLDDAYTELAIHQEHFWNDLVNKFGPGAVSAIGMVDKELAKFAKRIEATEHEIETIYGWYQKFHGPAERILKNPTGDELLHGPLTPDGKSAFGDLLDQLKKKLDNSPNRNPRSGYHPASFIDGNGIGADRANPLYRGVRDGVIDAMQQIMGVRDGVGGSGGFTNASYATGGGGARGSSGGRWGGGGYNPITEGSSGGGAIPKNAGVGASAYLGDSTVNGGGQFDRSRFIKELQDNPGLRDKIMRIAANEQGRNAAGTQAVIESMMNRANVRHTSLAEQAKWFRAERGGYYEMGNMGRGALENPKWRAILEKSLANALGGADSIDHATDNSSGALADRERATGKFDFHRKINGESFFSPGWAEPKFARAYRSMIEHEIASRAQNSRSNDLIRNRIDRDSGSVNTTGHASVSIDLNGFPKGTQTKAKATGLFKEVKLNRGKPMVMASEDG